MINKEEGESHSVYQSAIADFLARLRFPRRAHHLGRTGLRSEHLRLPEDGRHDETRSTTDALREVYGSLQYLT